MTVQSALERFKEMFSAAPDRLERFARGATAEELASFREKIGCVVPQALLDLHAWRDGTRPMALAGAEYDDGGIVCCSKWLALAGILESKQNWDELAREFERMQPEEQTRSHYALWNVRWIPLLEDDSTVTALTTTRCFGGAAGQIVQLDFKAGDGWSVDHESLDDWLKTISALAAADLLDEPRHGPKVEAVYQSLNPSRRWVQLSPEMLNQRFGEEVDGLSVGCRVLVVGGAFSGFGGTITKLLSGDRVMVNVDIMGQATPLTLKMTEIGRAEET